MKFTIDDLQLTILGRRNETIRRIEFNITNL